MTIVVIAASAGGLEPLRHIVGALTLPCFASVFVVWRSGHHGSLLPDMLGQRSALPCAFGVDGEKVQPGRIYVVPPHRHMSLELDRLRLEDIISPASANSVADHLFASAAGIYGPRVIGVVLSGDGHDGAAGLKAVTDNGGLSYVQHPLRAAVPSMPIAALATDTPEYLTVSEIGARLQKLCSLAHQH